MGLPSLITRVVKAVVPAGLRFALRLQAYHLRNKGAGWWLRWNYVQIDAWVRDRLNRRHYRHLSETQARARRKSDTVFVFGSGYSLTDITAAEWAHFAEHDVFGFNLFYYQRWVPVDFHLLKGGVYEELRWQPFADEVRSLLATNPNFSQTVFVLQEGYHAWFPNQLIGYRLLPKSVSALRFRTVRTDGPPTRSLAEGLRHHGGTLTDAVNGAFVLGWKHIVLVGVDLYDSRYFYLPPNQTQAIDPETLTVVGAEYNEARGQRFNEPHNTVRLGTVGVMAEWRAWMEKAGVRLSVYNPRSLLAEVLPLYERPIASAAQAGRSQHA